MAAAARGADYEGGEGSALRNEANEWAIRRSRLLEESQTAYLMGDKGYARRLADEAREAGQQMAALNVRARDAIFEHRNGGKDETFLDLHGLYVQEALYYLGETLRELTARGRLRRGRGSDGEFESPVLECVTGAGHHSPLGISRIKAAVHDLVGSLGLRCEVKNAGSFLIYC